MSARALARLDEVCTVLMGQAPSGTAYNDRGEGWPLIAGAGDFGRSLPAPKKFTTAASKLSRPGDIILGIRASIGEKVLSDGEYCLGRGVAALRPKESLDPGFLWHWLTANGPHLAAKGKGATFKQVNRQDIGELPIALPGLVEQRRIAEVLDRVNALRTKRRESLALFDDLTRSIFLETFGDPVKNERSWPETPLGALGDLERGVSKHRPRNAPSLLGGPYPLVQTGDVANSGGYITAFSSTYSERGLSQSRLWPAGTLCITIAANIAKTGILTFDACFPDSVVAFVADPPTTSYAQIWLSFWQKRLEDSAPESAQKNINLAILRNLMVPVPPLELRESFADRRRRVEQLRSRHLEHLTDLSSMFASLQQRAFAGEL